MEAKDDMALPCSLSAWETEVRPCIWRIQAKEEGFALSADMVARTRRRDAC